ncbi:dual specificity protein phosphatase 14-like isoform X2 [Saccoglossus kowalevskii]|uniref:protein-serine/threonine phosphatase n=1 Tax=Saccoglossus kowalevskii TaxID=10224 RepID=A0ABM0GQW9_SACKO|nr:PREDICTED: dual specificity protein phosphatase 14-like [Saccoglossus kowalevskii]
MFSPSVFHTMSPITEHLYLSSGAAASSANNLHLKGITCVVNATMTVEKPRGTLSHIRYIHIHVDDAPHAQLQPYFDIVADMIKQEKLRGGRTLVHCVAGVSRSASLCMAYLMKHEHLTLKDAHDYIKARRCVIRPNLGFWRQLVNYEYRLFGKNSVTMIPSNIGWIPSIYEKETRNMRW